MPFKPYDGIIYIPVPHTFTSGPRSAYLAYLAWIHGYRLDADIPTGTTLYSYLVFLHTVHSTRQYIYIAYNPRGR